MSQKRSSFLTNITAAEMDGVAELPKKPKKLLKKLVCASPAPAVPELPADLDKCTKISINGREMRIAADDLQFVCKLGELEEVVYFLYVGLHMHCWLGRVLYVETKTSEAWWCFNISKT